MNARHLLLTALATLVIFVAGIGTGHRLARTNLLPPPTPPQQPQGDGMPLMGRLDMYARMVRDLNLDPNQREQINRLIGERQEYLVDVIRLLDPSLHEMMPRLRRDVNAILRPQQQAELERRFTERLERAKREGDRMDRLRRENSGTMPEPRRMPRENQPEFRPGQRPPPRPGPNPNRPPVPPVPPPPPAGQFE